VAGDRGGGPEGPEGERSEEPQEPERQEAGSPKWEPPGPPADDHHETAFEFPGTNRHIQQCDKALDAMGPPLLAAEPNVRIAANLDCAEISERRATFREAVGQPARAAADRRSRWPA
jgi:hypothetical protein